MTLAGCTALVTGANRDIPGAMPLALEAVDAGAEEVLVDARARELKMQLAGDPDAVAASIQRAWDTRPRR